MSLWIPDHMMWDTGLFLALFSLLFKIKMINFEKRKSEYYTEYKKGIYFAL